MYSRGDRHEQLVRMAAERAQALPTRLRAAVEAFRIAPPPAGCLVLKGLPVGELPPTPPSPRVPINKSAATELLLLSFATLLGEPVGYLPEHGGDLVQNIVPVEANATRQTSTSSNIDLKFHTEAAFHPHRPKYVLLFCLRGDPIAHTSVASVNAALPHLPAHAVDVLFERRFRCAVDESYLDRRCNALGPPMAVLSGDLGDPAMVFDQDLMVGVDEEAEDALRMLGQTLSAHHVSVLLEAGDLLVIHNEMVVHGRSPFTPRLDGSDRWLQRAFVVADLAASEGERQGRSITTVFGVENV